MSDSSYRQSGMRRRHQSMLLVACGVVLLTFLLQVRGDQRVEFRWLPGYPLPQTCAARGFFDIDCPACGLTRSLIHLSRNDWQASFAVHRLGWLMAVAVMLQFPYRIFAILCGCDLPLGLRVPTLFGWALILLLVVNWILGIVP